MKLFARARDVPTFFIPPLLFAIVWLILSSVKSGGVRPGRLILFTPVGEIGSSLANSTLWVSALWTALQAATGLALSILIASSLAVVCYLRPVAIPAVKPWASALQAVPVVAVVPFVIVSLGFGFVAYAAVAMLISVWVIFDNCYNALKGVSQEALDLFAVMRASRRQELFKLRVPFGLPRIISALPAGAALAVVGAIVGGSLLATSDSSNLGSWIVIHQIRSEFAAANAGVVVAGIVSLSLVGIMHAVNSLFGHWFRWGEETDD